MAKSNKKDQLKDFPQEEVRSAIQQGILQAEKQHSYKKFSDNGKRNKKGKRKIIYAMSSLVASLGLLIGSSYYSPVLASGLSQIPIIGSVFGDSDLIGLQKAQKKGLTSEIGETQTTNGISVTLDEILYDQNNITIGYIIESEKELEEYYFGWGQFTIDDKFPSLASGGHKETIHSPTVRTGIQEIEVTGEMPEAFELGYILTGKNGETFYFSTFIEQITDFIKIPIQHSESVDGIELTVKDLLLSEPGVSLSYESSEEGTDFELSRAGNIEFLIVDQNGNEILSHSGGGKGEIFDNRMVFTSNKKFDPIDSAVKELTITPYLLLPTDGGGAGLDESGEMIEWEFRGGSLKPVDFKPFKVKLLP